MIGRIDFLNINERMYYIKYHLGSTRVTISNTDNTNTNHIVYAVDYYPYGEAARESEVGTKDGKYKFTEKERDKETGYDYFGARYYNNKLGIWMSVDPMEVKYPGWTPYKYCLDNPIYLIDPNGMTEKERLAVIAAANKYIGTKYGHSAPNIDCSGLVGKAIYDAMGINLNKGKGAGDAHNGVANIAGNCREVKFKDLRPGDIITMSSTGRDDHQGPDGKFDHTGIVKSITLDDDGNIAKVTFIEAGCSKGVTDITWTPDHKNGFEILGAYQYDTPDSKDEKGNNKTTKTEKKPGEFDSSEQDQSKVKQNQSKIKRDNN